MSKEVAIEILKILKKEYRNWNAPVVSLVAQHTKDPFKTLICALLSTRTRDETTAKVCEKVLKRIQRPEDILNIPLEELERLIYPVGFYKNKAKQLKEIAKELVEKYNGKVPSKLEELLKLKGVGRKVANLVLSDGFGIPAICVDTHVHRITNRWGIVKTRTPEETEKELMKIYPTDMWKDINKVLVAFGQKICLPVNPKCEECPVLKFCKFRRGEK